jgi:hypothetical protein
MSADDFMPLIDSLFAKKNNKNSACFYEIVKILPVTLFR